MGTKLHGPLAGSQLDSAGEQLLLEGLDISALKVANYEHSSSLPAQNVGRVISAKKIFGPEDCENDDQLKFFERLNKTPYLYGIIELFDDVGHDGASDIAAMARYDAKNADQYDYRSKYPLLGASVEGSKIEKQGHVITKSLARKISVTVSPCNRVCWLELFPEQNQQVTDQKPIAKKEEKSRQKTILEKMLKFEDISPEMESLVKSDLESLTKSELAKADPTTKAGKPISMAWDPVHYHQNKFSSQDHKDAMNYHYDAAMSTTEPVKKQHHMKMVGLHQKSAEKSPWSSKNAPVPTPKPEAGQSGVYQIPSPASKPVPHVNPSTNIGYTNIPGKGRGVSKMEKSIPGTNGPLNPEVWATKEMKKAVHMPTSASGVSNMGIEARRGDTRKPGVMAHGFGRVTKPETHMATAKKMAAKQLESIRNEPKPNLPKSEDLQKSEQAPPVDVSIPTWEKVEAFRAWIAEKIPTLSKNEVNAFTRAFKIFKIKQAEKKLEDLK